MGNILSSNRQFSYADYPLPSTDPQSHVQIRLLQLYPCPLSWYMNWLPMFLRNYMFPLRGSLEIKYLRKDSHPQYTALSYTWGHPGASSQIIINNTRLAITPSLAEALHYLRPETAPLTIWIDQICINQMDDTEKSRQVQAMDKIYKSSEETLVWLGSPSSGSNHLMDVLIQMGKFAEDFDLPGYFTKARISELLRIYAKDNPKDPATIEYHRFCDEVVPLFTHGLLASLIALQRRVWFQRSWVLQEFTLAKEVTFTCGSRRIRAEILMSVLSMIGKTIIDSLLQKSPDDRKLAVLIEEMNGLQTLLPFSSSRQRRKAFDEGRYKGDSLYQVLQRAHIDNSLQATQACDKVYGLLGLACDKDEMIKLGVSTDYELAKKEPEIVFIKTARALINSGKVDTLLFAQHYKGDTNQDLAVPQIMSSRVSYFKRPFMWVRDIVFADTNNKEAEERSIPSWVPDWQQHIQRSFVWLRDEADDPLFSASKELTFQPITVPTGDVLTKEEERVLTLRGYCVDEIEEVGEVWEGGPRNWNASQPVPYEAYLDHLEQVRRMCRLAKVKNINIHASEQRWDEAEWRVPVGDIEQDASAAATRAKAS